MSRDPRDWQADMDMCESVKDAKWSTLTSSATAVWQRGGLLSTIWEGVDAEALKEHREALPYWLQQAKRLTADKARLTIDMYADANNYQVQAVEIGELRKELERMRLTAEIKYIQHTREKHENETTLLLEHISKAEEREQKLIKALERVKHYTNEAYARHEAHEVLSILYPLERKDTPNGL